MSKWTSMRSDFVFVVSQHTVADRVEIEMTAKYSSTTKKVRTIFVFLFHLIIYLLGFAFGLADFHFLILFLLDIEPTL